jgi:hypothetical protein
VAAIHHIHGGATGVGSGRAGRHLAGRRAARAKTATFIPDDRLAPGHPSSAAAQDAAAAHRGPTDRGTDPIAIAGWHPRRSRPPAMGGAPDRAEYNTLTEPGSPCRPFSLGRTTGAFNLMLTRAIKNTLRSRLRRDQLADLRRGVGPYVAPLVAHDLRKLASLFGTDKWTARPDSAVGHFYAQHYQRHFRPFRWRKINLLEIGVGGQDDRHLGGESLRMWRSYFPRAHIYGLDIFDKSKHEGRRITIFRGSQDDEVFLQDVARRIGTIDLIIDDGSHVNAHVIKTFQTLFPLLADGGIYVIEDTQTSYWSEYGGNPVDLNAPGTSMSMTKALVDGLNHVEFKPDDVFSYTDVNIRGIHFYHNIVFIEKGPNLEPCNHKDLKQQSLEAAGRHAVTG